VIGLVQWPGKIMGVSLRLLYLIFDRLPQLAVATRTHLVVPTRKHLTEQIVGCGLDQASWWC
jgi:hypothetical protein